MKLLGREIHYVRGHQGQDRVDAGVGREQAVDKIKNQPDHDPGNDSHYRDHEEIDDRVFEDKLPRHYRGQRDAENYQARRVVDQALALAGWSEGGAGPLFPSIRSCRHGVRRRDYSPEQKPERQRKPGNNSG